MVMRSVGLFVLAAGNSAANHGGFTDSGLGRAPAFSSSIVGLVEYAIAGNVTVSVRPSFVMGGESE